MADELKEVSKVKIPGLNEAVALKDAAARTRLTSAESAIESLENSKQDVIDASHKLAAAYVSITKPSGSDSKLTSADVNAAIYELEAAIETGGTGSVVTVEQQATAETGYFATYVIKQGGSAVTGPKINIPKDFLVKSASIKTVEKKDEPYSGAEVGDKYIDFVINVKEGSATDEHLYLPVNELVDAYTGDNTTITLGSGNVFSIAEGVMNRIAAVEASLPVLSSAIEAEEDRATDAEVALGSRIDTLEGSLGDLAYKDSATGTVASQTITGVKASGNIGGDVTVDIGVTSTTMEFTDAQKAAYTPAGTLTKVSSGSGDFNVVTGGTVNVVLGSTSAEGAITSYDNYTPEGTVTMNLNNAGSFQVAGTNDSSTVHISTGSSLSFVTGLKDGNDDAATIDTTKFNGGTAATWTGAEYTAPTFSHSGFSGGALGTASSDSFVNKVLKANVIENEDDDDYTLDLTNFVGVSDSTVSGNFATAITAQGSFTPASEGTFTFTSGSVDFGTFNGGTTASISDGFLTAKKIPVIAGSASAITELGDAYAEGQTFTGAKYNPAFAGTSAAIKATKTAYNAATVSSATFNPSTEGVKFTGTTVSKLIPTSYDYVVVDSSATGAFSGSATLDVGDIVVASKSVTVS